MEWVNGFLIPLIEVIFIFGIIGTILFFIGKGFHNAWTRQTKFFFRYKLPFFKKPYPESTLMWVLSCIDQGIGYYDAKKLLMVKMIPDDQTNETLWIYDQVINELNIKGGLKNDRKFKGSNSQTQTATELPSFTG